jgi:uncharacterized protein (DUF1330 family)
MTAYVIFIREETRDQAELDIYSEKVRAVLEGLPVTVLSAYGRMEVFEGKAPEGVVIVSFPTFQQATEWYHSEAYQAIVGHRHRGASYRGLVVQGLE